MEAAEGKTWPTPSYKLVPDDETRKRVEALGRDPDSFYIHADAKDPKMLGRVSSGCIALGPDERERLKDFKGRWIRVGK